LDHHDRDSGEKRIEIKLEEEMMTNSQIIGDIIGIKRNGAYLFIWCVLLLAGGAEDIERRQFKLN